MSKWGKAWNWTMLVAAMLAAIYACLQWVGVVETSWTVYPLALLTCVTLVLDAGQRLVDGSAR